ncbi:hypothetical protein C0995_000407 [Termitomyces sp. Mi166|nr:hypothetical protein C0995_000407 [Termitomyces sp. Mi166\
MRFSGFFVISSLVFSALALPAADFSAQLSALSAKVNAVTTQAKNFDGTSAKFNNFHTTALSLAQAVSSANDALNVLNPVSSGHQSGSYPAFTAAESSANIAASSALVGNVGQLADTLIDKKPAFAKIPNGVATVRNDAASVADPAFKLVQGLINRTPTGDVPKAKALQNLADAHFARLLAAYSQ